jgi:hypothetical protein
MQLPDGGVAGRRRNHRIQREFNNGLSNSYPAFSQVENWTGCCPNLFKRLLKPLLAKRVKGDLNPADICGGTWRVRLQIAWSEAYRYQKTL